MRGKYVTQTPSAIVASSVIEVIRPVTADGAGPGPQSKPELDRGDRT